MANTCPCLPAGKLRSRIELQAPSYSTDGENTPTWSTTRTARASVSWAGGGESFRGVQVSAIATRKIVCRYQSLGPTPEATITPQMRVLWRGLTMYIVAAGDPDDRRREFWIFTREDQG